MSTENSSEQDDEMNINPLNSINNEEGEATIFNTSKKAIKRAPTITRQDDNTDTTSS